MGAAAAVKSRVTYSDGEREVSITPISEEGDGSFSSSRHISVVRGNAELQGASFRSARVHAVAGAECRMRSRSTAVEFMMTEASNTSCKPKTGLPMSRHEQRRTQHALSVEVGCTLLMRLRQKSGDHTRVLA